MTPTRWIWAALIGLYAVFFGWYTSFAGPLTDAEVEHYMALFAQNEPAPPPHELVHMRKWMEEDTGDDFVMVNIIHMRETPLKIEGVEPGETSYEVQAKYMEYTRPQLFRRAGHPMFYGQAANAAMDLMNAEGMEAWSHAVGTRYRSRRDLLEIAMNPEFAGRHEFKVAAMAKTIAFPVDPWVNLGDPRLVLALLLGGIGFGLSWRVAAR